MDNETHIRTKIIDALEASIASPLTGISKRRKFLSGRSDYAFDELDMDSLGRMEFCIYLEVNGVYIITPEELQSLKSLNQLIALIMSSKS